MMEPMSNQPPSSRTESFKEGRIGSAGARVDVLDDEGYFAAEGVMLGEHEDGWEVSVDRGHTDGPVREIHPSHRLIS